MRGRRTKTLPDAYDPDTFRALTAEDAEDRRSNELAWVILAVAVGCLLINVIPTITVGFYNDDFRMMNLFQEWGGNFWRALQQDGTTWGFRPLLHVQRLAVWNLLGDHPVYHRLILALVHIGFGWILYRAARILGGSSLHGAVVVFLYFASQVTLSTVFRYVAFSPSNILSLGALLVMLIGVKGNWPATKLVFWTILLAALAAFSKEDGIAAASGVLLLTVFLWNRLDLRQRTWIMASHALLIIVYLSIYLSLSPGITSSMSDGPLTIDPAMITKSLDHTTLTNDQAVAVFKGLVISAGAPFSAIYLSLRAHGIIPLAAALVAIFSLFTVIWLIWVGHGSDIKQVGAALRNRLLLGVAVGLLMLGFLGLYLSNNWFEPRMIVSTFAMGILLWGIVIADALQGLISRSNQTVRPRLMYGIGVVLILGLLAVGGPIVDGNLRVQLSTAESMRTLVRQAEARGLRHICLIDFRKSDGDQASALRIGNAHHLVGYESRRTISVHPFRTAAEIPDNLECLVVTYDLQVMNEVPLAVRWPSERAGDAAPRERTQP